MDPGYAIRALDDSISRGGDRIKVRRYAGVGQFEDVEAGGFVTGSLSLTEIAPGFADGQIGGKIIISPTGIEKFLPLRTTDKVVLNGQEKTLGMVENKQIASKIVRIDAAFLG